jgi:hypothetical protein
MLKTPLELPTCNLNVHTDTVANHFNNALSSNMYQIF